MTMWRGLHNPDYHEDITEYEPAPWLQTKGCTQWRKMVPHVEHNWWAGIYCPTGDIDGYLVFCPGFTRGSCRPEALR